MNSKKVAVIISVLVLALFVAACGSDESREDADDVANGKVEKSEPSVIAFNNHYPNVQTKCDGYGHRIYVTTHDSSTGDNLYIIPDVTCTGKGTSYDEILESGEQPHNVAPTDMTNQPPSTVSP